MAPTSDIRDNALQKLAVPETGLERKSALTEGIDAALLGEVRSLLHRYPPEEVARAMASEAPQFFPRVPPPLTLNSRNVEGIAHDVTTLVRHSHMMLEKIWYNVGEGRSSPVLFLCNHSTLQYLVAEYEGRSNDAKVCLENTLSIAQAGYSKLYENRRSLDEFQTIVNGVKDGSDMDPSTHRHNFWYFLSDIMRRIQDHLSFRCQFPGPSSPDGLNSSPELLHVPAEGKKIDTGKLGEVLGNTSALATLSGNMFVAIFEHEPIVGSIGHRAAIGALLNEFVLQYMIAEWEGRSEDSTLYITNLTNSVKEIQSRGYAPSESAALVKALEEIQAGKRAVHPEGIKDPAPFLRAVCDYTFDSTHFSAKPMLN